MNKEEYKLALSELARKYAFGNNMVEISDIVIDDIGAVLVDKIKYTRGCTNEFPQCVYYGLELKKDLTPKKSGERRGVYQCNMVKHITHPAPS